MAPRNVIGELSHAGPLSDPWRRRGIFAVMIVICAVFTLFPQKYLAAVTMTPTDPASLGLSSALGEFGAVNSVFGNQAAVEVVMKVGRSIEVRRAVSAKVDLMRRKGFTNAVDADRWLEREVTIRSLRGGILEMATSQRDPDFARALVGAFADATRDQLAAIGRRQTAYKRGILVKLIADADVKLANTQAAYDEFRRRTRYAQPAAAIAAIGSRVSQLKDIIRSKEVQLTAARQFATDENQSVRQLLAEIQSLRGYLAEAEALNPSQADSVGDVVVKSTQVRELERQLIIARALHDNYERFLNGTAVEDITQTAVVRIIEAPYVNSARQFNLLPMMLGLLLIGLALAIEFYRLRPPVGDRKASA
ncbi:MAG: hypothetical protein ABI810_17750 [Sphingomonas bacterium]